MIADPIAGAFPHTVFIRGALNEAVADLGATPGVTHADVVWRLAAIKVEALSRFPSVPRRRLNDVWNRELGLQIYSSGGDRGTLKKLRDEIRRAEVVMEDNG
jgi:hypothetical protein